MPKTIKFDGVVIKHIDLAFACEKCDKLVVKGSFDIENMRSEGLRCPICQQNYKWQVSRIGSSSELIIEKE
ncbi:hypothetical protein FACS189476_00410 [Spirochaetia bacterium]|nr:hypothetical protein FACS189476_00410 [Spirochaetia bacterium]